MVTGASIFLLVALFGLAATVLSIYAAVRAFNNDDTGWGIGILIAMLVPFGFILAIVYLAQQGSRTTA